MSNNWLYFEFFLSPKGNFVAPKPLLRTVKKFNGYTTHSISPDLILIVRYGIISALEGWHPEIEITFIPNELI